jgi:hypothetical protein
LIHIIRRLEEHIPAGLIIPNAKAPLSDGEAT